MANLAVAFFGDIVGEPGRRAFAHAAKALREQGRVDLVIVNGENARNGSGLSPDNYKEIRRAGADAITLGDHCFKDARIADYLDDGAKPVSRPANISARARGKTRVRLIPPGLPSEAGGGTHVVTLLGRIFMSMPADDPFAALDREVDRVARSDPEGIVIVEVHAEATSEKIALAWHALANWPRRVVAVVGTHTHVQTADARILDDSLAAITDLGMCGGHRGIIGRMAEPVLGFMTRQAPAAFAVADQDLAACGAILTIDTAARRCLSIEAIRIPAPTPDTDGPKISRPAPARGQ